MEVMHLLTPKQEQLTQAVHLLITTQGTATIECTALGDDDQTPHAQPTQAVWINATANTEIALDPDPGWTAVHYTLDCAENDPSPKLTASTTSPSTTPSRRRQWSPRDASPVHHASRGSDPDQRGTLPNPPGHPQRPPIRGVHNIPELPNRHRHSAPGRRTHTATYRHGARQGSPSHGAQGGCPTGLDAARPRRATRSPQRQQSTADRAPDTPTNTRQRRRPSAPQPMDGTRRHRRPGGQSERHQITNHTCPGAHTSPLHHSPPQT